MTSCIGYRNNPNTIINTAKDGSLLAIENKKENFTIEYFGDYWFHHLDKKTTLNFDGNFVKLLKKTPANGLFLYAGHTTGEPYCSTLGMLYKTTSIAPILTYTSTYLKKNLKAENLTTSTQVIGKNSFQIIAYELPSPKLKVNYKYLEYYLVRKKDCLRIVFWTTESKHNWLKTESEALILKITDNS